MSLPSFGVRCVIYFGLHNIQQWIYNHSISWKDCAYNLLFSHSPFPHFFCFLSILIYRLTNWHWITNLWWTPWRYLVRYKRSHKTCLLGTYNLLHKIRWMHECLQHKRYYSIDIQGRKKLYLLEIFDSWTRLWIVAREGKTTLGERNNMNKSVKTGRSRFSGLQVVRFVCSKEKVRGRTM